MHKTWLQSAYKPSSSNNNIIYNKKACLILAYVQLSNSGHNIENIGNCKFFVGCFFIFLAQLQTISPSSV